MPMIWIDYAILGLLAISVIMGVVRGFAAEAYALMVWLLATGVACSLSPEFAAFYTRWIVDLSCRLVAASVSLYLLTLLFGAVIGYLLNTELSISGISFLSRLTGSCVGFTRGILITTIIILFAGMTSLPAESWWQESQLVFPFQKLALLLKNVLPTVLAEQVKFK